MIHLVLNPLAGVGSSRDFLDRLRRWLGESACLCPFPFEQHLAEHYQRTHGAGDDRILLVGGDGTVNRAVNAMGVHAPPVVLVPSGTANDLAMSLGVPPDPEDASRLARTGHVRGIDLISVNGKLFATCGGIGVAARAAGVVNEWKAGGGARSRFVRRLGHRAYALAALRGLACSSRTIGVEIDWDDERRTEEVAALLVANQPRLGRRYLVAPAATATDGRVDLCSIPWPSDPGERLALLREAVRGRIGQLSFARHLQVREVTIRTERVVPFFGDGEVLDENDRFRVRVLPSALRVVAPPEREELRRVA